MKTKLLYIAPHRPGRSPGQRFRFEQFMTYLQEQGFEITYSYLLNSIDDKIFYQKGNYLIKLFIGFKGLLIRTRDWLRAGRFDIILVYREAHFIGTTFFEKRFARSRAKLVFDFDDAIWLNDTSEANSNLSWLKKPEKIGEIIQLSDLVIAGNKYLADYARIFTNDVIIIPTSIDTNYHKPQTPDKNNTVCIGWTGSSTTIKHFQDAVPWLSRLKEKYDDKITFKVIVDAKMSWPELGIKSTPWTKRTEIDELNTIDIGIMPLPDDQWSRGKCAFKGLQYMALEKPAVMSPVGVNNDLILENENGFLAANENEWISKLSALIDSEGLRIRIGKAGRKTVVDAYSVDVQKVVFADVLKSLVHLPE
ncbi:MAG: glycosyltransferase family 4 protein [Salinivirgaceae bacterium]